MHLGQEDRRDGVRGLDHGEVTGFDSDWLDTDVLLCDPPRPRRLEELVVGGVDEGGGDTRLPPQGVGIAWRRARPQPLGQRARDLGRKTRVHRSNRGFWLPDARSVGAIWREREPLTA